MMGFPTPDFLKSMNENKLMYSVAAFFIFAQVSTGLRSTGAFEVHINDQLVYSKLETGENITAPILHDLFEPYGVTFVRQGRLRT